MCTAGVNSGGRLGGGGSMATRRRPTTAGVLVVAVTLTLAALVADPAPGGAQTDPDQRGPAPTAASVIAPRGPYPFATTAVVGSSSLGFNRGTISYPTLTSETFGAVAVIPGFISPEAWIAWIGPFLASNGFVVFTLDTFSGFDGPGSRAAQLDAALDYLTTGAPAAVRARVDPRRLGAVGHSSGGGGALVLAASRSQPDLRAIVSLQPWSIAEPATTVRVPTLQVGVADDVIAPPGVNARAVHAQIPATTEHAYLEISSGGHFVGNGYQADQARAMLSWLKRFVDDDTRYSPFVCPGPAVGGAVSAYPSTCPV
jgi:cutinase